MQRRRSRSRRSSVAGFCWFDCGWISVSVAPALSFSAQAVCSLSIYANPYSCKWGARDMERERERERERGRGRRVTWGKYGERESWRKQGKLAEIWARKAAHIVWLKTFLQVDGFSQKIKREWGRVDRDTMSR